VNSAASTKTSLVYRGKKGKPSLGNIGEGQGKWEELGTPLKNPPV
jgi:hypothetical protein